MVSCVHDGDGFGKRHRSDVDDFRLIRIRNGALLVNLRPDAIGEPRRLDDLVAGDVPQSQLSIENVQD